jgi:hypothetical protein
VVQRQSGATERAGVKPTVGGTVPDAMYSGGIEDGPGTSDPERLSAQGIALNYLLLRAFNVKPYQPSGPCWIRKGSLRYQRDDSRRLYAGEMHVMLSGDAGRLVQIEGAS